MSFYKTFFESGNAIVFVFLFSTIYLIYSIAKE